MFINVVLNKTLVILLDESLKNITVFSFQKTSPPM